MDIFLNFVYSHKVSGISILKSSFWYVSSIAIIILGRANPDPFNVCKYSVFDLGVFLNLVLDLRLWKSVQFDTELTSNHSLDPGDHTSIS